MATIEINHIIWDWNGTLLDDIAACVGAINLMLARRGLTELDHDRYRDIFGFPVRGFYLDIGFDLETEDWDTVAREYHRAYLALAADAHLRRGAHRILQWIDSRGISMSLLSASEQSILEDMLADRGISGLFSGVYGLDNLHAVSKLDLGRTLLADLRVVPDKALLIGDTIHDYEVASVLGCRCLLLAGGHQAAHRLAGCGCALASGLDEVQRIIEDGGRKQDGDFAQHTG